MTTNGSVFTDAELRYLSDRRLGRLATVGRDGTPHVAPVGWRYDSEEDAVDVGGRNFERSKKYRDVARSGRAAIVIDDLVSVDPWRPRGIEIRGRAEVLEDPPRVRIRPERIVSWGLEDDDLFRQHARTVG
ncbi:MAG TPA: PPOX class F420-dependent oxidoreductase [Acidimicrobiia bacterium]|nr:PPOX class F420-dependent oxidoreductase [Acidimicrobiia bacterium]